MNTAPERAPEGPKKNPARKKMAEMMPKENEENSSREKEVDALRREGIPPKESLSWKSLHNSTKAMLEKHGYRFASKNDIPNALLMNNIGETLNAAYRKASYFFNNPKEGSVFNFSYEDVSGKRSYEITIDNNQIHFAEKASF